jgi:hypothetical protein
VQLRYAILGDRHPSILQPLWNLFAQFQQAGINEKANRCFNIANRIVHTDGITAHPNLFMIYNHMNDFVKQATNGAKSFVDVIPFHGNDHVTSRDSMLATYFDDIEFDIYKMYCEKAGNKLNMIEHIIMVPILNVYSLPEAEYFSLSEFVSDNGLQEYVNKSHKITTVPANFYSDNAASPFYEFTIYDVENRRLLLPAVTDSHWKGMPQLAYNETEWFDFIFNDLVFGTNLKMEDII